MMKFSLIALLVACSSSFASAAAVFAPGEIIVKFRDASQEGQAVKAATRSSDKQSLSPVVKDLETKLGLPLTLKQLLSGDRILVAIQCRELTEHVGQQLRKRVNVEDISNEFAGTGGCKPTSSPTVKVMFRPSTVEHRTVSMAAAESTKEFRHLVDDLETIVKVPFDAKATEKGELVLTLDIMEMTTRTAKLLQAITDVESAQPNYMMNFR